MKIEQKEREKLSKQTVYEDLQNLETKFGPHILKVLLTQVIIEFMWWNWPRFRDNFITDIEKELKND